MTFSRSAWSYASHLRVELRREIELAVNTTDYRRSSEDEFLWVRGYGDSLPETVT